VSHLRDWLGSNSRRSGSRIILAADVDGPYSARLERASSLVAAVREGVVAVKVNWHLLLPYGVLGLRELVGRCHDAGLPLIADMKLNDIGATNVEAAEILFANGFDALIANPFVGYKEGIDDLVVKSREMQKGVILLVYMSHSGASEGYGLITTTTATTKTAEGPLYLRFARDVKEWGADGAVVSSKSTSVIREVKEIIGEERFIVSPGVGFQGGDARRALEAGADYLIVGRSITRAKDPAKSLDELNRGLRVEAQ
jgi:orotidine-5'-phosphate decarboxylase